MAEGKMKRRILGEQIIRGIRFPTMILEDVSGAVQGSNILTKEEIVSVIKCLGSVTSFPVGFIKTKRRGYQFDGDVQQCCRFGLSSASG